MSATPAKTPPEKPREIYVKRPRCPDCGALDPLAYKTTSSDEGDGTKTRRVRCRACGVKFLLILEGTPDSGDP